MTSVLQHCCCGPCATYPSRWLAEHDAEMTAFWYNPNIHPFMEHQKRLESMQALAKQMGFPLIIDEGYDMPHYFSSIVGHEDNRCAKCYQIRLNKTAQFAHENGFDSFTTTLLISPYQNQDLIKEVGERAAHLNNTEFLFHDFREGFRESQQMAKEFDLYRQKYCGCVYSEWERYSKVKVGGRGS